MAIIAGYTSRLILKKDGIKMSKKLTKKSITFCFSNIYQLPANAIDYLTWDINPHGHTEGIHGWNADIYIIGSAAVVTGYRPFGQRVDYDIVKTYEEQARQIVQANDLDYETKIERLSDLRYTLFNVTIPAYGVTK